MPKLAKHWHTADLIYSYKNVEAGVSISTPVFVQPFFHVAMLAMFAQEDAPISDHEHIFISNLVSTRYKDFAPSETIDSLLSSAYAETLSCRYFAKRLVGLVPHQPRVVEIFLDDLMSLALCDAPLNSNELEALREIAQCFGFSRAHFHQQLRYHTMPGYQDPYKLLGVEENVTEEILKQRYRQAIKSCHPDNWPLQSISEEMNIILRDQFQAINTAYEMIKTKKKFR